MYDCSYNNANVSISFESIYVLLPLNQSDGVPSGLCWQVNRCCTYTEYLHVGQVDRYVKASPYMKPT